METFKTEAELQAYLLGKSNAEAKEEQVRILAAADPLPGPLLQAFTPFPDIPVGKYQVRMFTDGDFERLKVLNHPVGYIMQAAMSGQTDALASQDNARGPAAWQLCYLMTRPAKEAKAKLREGINVFCDAAEDEFGELPIGALTALYLAIARQIAVYWSTVLSYGVPKGAEGEQGPNPTTPSGSTGSAGSLTSAAA